jgi:hypothetical protein
MLTVDVPGDAEGVARSVSRQLPGAGPGPNDGITPGGTPVTVTVTVPVKPFCGTRITVAAFAAPTGTVRDAGETDSANGDDDGDGVLIVRVTAALLVRLPDVPVMVTVAVPGLALDVAENVRVLWLVVLAGLNPAVTPLGKPETESATVPAKPFSPLIAIVLAPFAPGAMVRLDGVTKRPNRGGAAIVSAIETLPVRLPEVPVIRTVAAPGAAELEALRVTEVPVVTVDDPKVAVTPAGRPLTDRFTEPVKPPCPLTEMLLPPLPPGLRLMLVGDAPSVKPGTPVTARAIVVLLVIAPATPLMVTVAWPGAALPSTLNVKVLA